MSSMVIPDTGARPDPSSLLADTNPKCSLLLEWGDHAGAHKVGEPSDTSDNTSEDTSLEEISDSVINSSSFELIKAKEKIFDLERELKNKEAQYELLLKKVKSN